MLAIEVELLTGRYVATAHNDRRRAEWPPHPARFFSALVAALHSRDRVDHLEREVLLWLENQDPPALQVDLNVDEHAGRREVHEVYVPVNDVSVIAEGTWARLWNAADALRNARNQLTALEGQQGTNQAERETKSASKAVAKLEKKFVDIVAKARAVDEHASPQSALSLLPDSRKRQVRTFPVAVPTRPTFTFVWYSDLPSQLRNPLDRLCERVTRLGHSSSFVRCAVVERDVAANLRPDPDGNQVLRVVGPGQLARLEHEHEWHQQVESRVLPFRPQRYGTARALQQEDVAESVFTGEWELFQRVGGARPLASRGTDLTQALRRALLEMNGPGALPGVLTGHRQGGAPESTDHVAFVACPFVGHAHADGSVQGCAIVLPRSLSRAERTTLRRLVASWERERGSEQETGRPVLELAGEMLPPVRFIRVDIADKWSLRPATWCSPAKRFVTATPIALDRHPGKLRSNYGRTAHKAAIEAERTIAGACERIGLPRPVSVEISLAPLLPGAQHVRDFLPWPGKPGRTARARVHADIRFDRRVRGPVLLGAGRYFGLGLCLPIREREEVPW